jgi:hypothetical protein
MILLVLGLIRLLGLALGSRVLGGGGVTVGMVEKIAEKQSEE